MGARFLLVRDGSYKFGKGENFKHCGLKIGTTHGFLYTDIYISSKSSFLNTFLHKQKLKNNKQKPNKQTNKHSFEKWLILGCGRKSSGKPGTFSCVKK